LTNEEDSEYADERIIDYNRQNGKYVVKWENYDDPTWEPLSHLKHCRALVNKLHKKLKLKPVRTWGTQLCGANRTEGSRQNPKNWVTLKKLAEVTTKFIRAR